MKKKSIVKFACLGLPLLLAHATTPAQTVATLYGVLDVGVQYLSNANSAGKSQISLASGSFLPSRFGIKGQEDLGGGYNAFFLLESGFNVDDGSQASAATFFNRFSYIGLNTPYGAITLGRQGSVQYNKTYLYDPLYYATYSNLSLNAAPISILKINNAVQYHPRISTALTSNWNMASGKSWLEIPALAGMSVAHSNTSTTPSRHACSKSERAAA